MTEQIQVITELITAIPGATVEISGDSIKITGINSLSSEPQNSRGKKRQAKKLPKVLKPGDMEKIYAALKLERFADFRDRCAIQVMYSSALRISEICNLMVDDVDLKGGYLTLQRAKGNKDRVVPIDDETIAWLKRWEVKRPQSDYYFCTKKGGQMDTRQLREKVYRTSEKAGVYIRDGDIKRKVNPHAFRHTGLTDMLDQGFTVRELQEMAGHKSLKTTSIYLSVRPESLRAKMKNRNIG